MSTTAANGSCMHCGSGFPHQGTCPRIHAIEYYPDGTVKRVEYVQPLTLTAGPAFAGLPAHHQPTGGEP